MTVPASSGGSMSASEPPNVPIAERAAPRTTTSRLSMSLFPSKIVAEPANWSLVAGLDITPDQCKRIRRRGRRCTTPRRSAGSARILPLSIHHGPLEMGLLHLLVGERQRAHALRLLRLVQTRRRVAHGAFLAPISWPTSAGSQKASLALEPGPPTGCALVARPKSTTTVAPQMSRILRM